MKTCIECGGPISGRGKKFCSLSCSCTYNGRIKKNGPHKDRTKICENPACGKEYQYGYSSRQKFCSSSCAAVVSNAVKKILCRRCNKPCGTGRVWCSKECRRKFPVEQWIAGNISACNKYSLAEWARKYVLERAGYRCEAVDSRNNRRCDEERTRDDGSTVLQVDHIDGNWQNCRPNNLRALCPTCHALTDTWGPANMGNGRTWKKDYNQFAKKV